MDTELLIEGEVTKVQAQIEIPAIQERLVFEDAKVSVKNLKTGHQIDPPRTLNPKVALERTLSQLISQPVDIEVKKSENVNPNQDRIEQIKENLRNAAKTIAKTMVLYAGDLDTATQSKIYLYLHQSIIEETEHARRQHIKD